MNKTRNYYRKATISLPKRKRISHRKSVTRFFLRLLILFILLGLILVGGYWGGKALIRLYKQARVADWQVKTVVVRGVDGPIYKALTNLIRPHQAKSFTSKQASSLRHTISKKYPMLKDVTVNRGLFNGKLTVSVAHRTPLVKFVSADGTTKYIDNERQVYADPYAVNTSFIPSVKLEGDIPEKLNAEFIDLVESTLKLNKELNFSRLHLNLTTNTVQMYLPDGTELDFGAAKHLKDKVMCSAQILTLARKKYKGPFVVNFQFFEDGKVFLTQKAP